MHPTAERRDASPFLDRRLARCVLLGAATQMFSQYGFHGSSMQEIAELAGQSKPRLYSYFPSKDDLYLAVLEHEECQLNQCLIGPLAKLARLHPGDLVATCEEMVSLICRYQRERPDGSLFLFGSVNWRIETERRRRYVMRAGAAVLHCIRPHIPAQRTNGTAALIACSVVATVAATTEQAIAGRVTCEEAADTVAWIVRAVVDMTIQGTEPASKEDAAAAEDDK